jgi:FSR family fosmidomycin resistance protein-like MFS transporter
MSRRKVGWSLAILLTLVFSKSFYQTSLGSYYTFYLIDKFGLSIRDAQVYLFVFLASVALGTLAGGPIGDRIGRKAVIWGSILGVIPFTLLLPYASLMWTAILTVVIGSTLASASSAIIVYAFDLVPGKIGTIAGLFFGLSFGLAGVGAAAFGWLADVTSIGFVYRLCAFLPLIGLVTIFLPDLGRPMRAAVMRKPVEARP